MSDEVDSAFVEIIASLPPIDADRMAALYKDPAPQAEPEPDSGPLALVFGCSVRFLIALAIVALVFGLVASGTPAEHPAPATHRVPAPCSGPSSPCSAY